MATHARSFDTEYRHIEVKPLGANLGAAILSVDLTQSQSEPAFKEIYAALMTHEVILFRGQDITIEQQMAFGQLFGELSVHPFSPNRGENPEVIVLDNNKDNPPALTDQWHSDETFREAPPFGTILRAKIIPPVGGNTIFCSMVTAYDGLSERMKAHIEGLVAEHDFLPFRTLFGRDPDSVHRLREIEDNYPRQHHPVVRVHPVTGRKLIYVNPQFVTHIVGLAQEESRMLLEFLFAQARVPENQFRVLWEPNTVVMWDNTAVQHYAPHDYFPHHRSMERVTISGDKPFGPIDDGLLNGVDLESVEKSGDWSKGEVVRNYDRAP